MSRRSGTLFVLWSALWALAALGFVAASIAAAAPPIKIALEAPLTGSQSSTGRDMLRGVQLAVRQANAHGGVRGRRIKIVRADDKGDRAQAKRVARRVIRQKVAAVIGPYNSSVGIVNLPIYLKNRVVPVHLTSTDDTRGLGITIQPKNSQIAPLEETFIRSTAAKKVTMLVDDTPNGAFTVGMADRLQARLAADGVGVTRISVQELGNNPPPGYYATKVAEALATLPGLIYSSTYYPEGAEIAKALGRHNRATVPDGAGERRPRVCRGRRHWAESALHVQRRPGRAAAAFGQDLRASVSEGLQARARRVGCVHV